jgi:hypothetical protein
MVAKTGITIPQHVGEAAEVNYSGAPAADFGPLARDKIPVRSMTEGDLRALVTIRSGSSWRASISANSAGSKPPR